ncbi:MAG: hypothetical protein OXU77_05390 [Gammaproteobacteria bacterium]|nr:hypothetical protein [Gammaproteobacteria bacterium]MDE0442152.1 hypothetical protein [Gammaproteobacteria bacterium]
MNEASHAEEAALDAATDALLGRLTADGSSRVQALVQSEIKNRSSVAIDWEGIATDLPQVMEGIAEGACDRYEVMVGIEAVLAKGRVDSL